MHQYHKLLEEVLNFGRQQENRTGTDTIRLPYGSMMRFNLDDGFPLVTTKAMAFKALKGELIAFLRAAESAADFRALGCNFWDQNANENKAWLQNPYRKGEDDLGRIYGAQWRRRLGDFEYIVDSHLPLDQQCTFRIRTIDQGELGVIVKEGDQIMDALYTIHANPSDRGIIIDAWVPSEFKQMALRPCHVLYQFNVDIEMKELSLCMYQRSADMFLGVPMNIGSSALLLKIFAHLTGYKAKYFTHFISDAHIYVNHLDQVREQLTRAPQPLPTVRFSERIPEYKSGDVFKPTLINIIGPEDILLEGYEPWPAIKAPMAV